MQESKPICRLLPGNRSCFVLFSMTLLVALPLMSPDYLLTRWGWLRGEPCYEGRPVSYWRGKLQGWKMDGGYGYWHHYDLKAQLLCWLEHDPRLCQLSWLKNKQPPIYWLSFAEPGNEVCTPPFSYSMPLPLKNKDALPVLVELLKDDDEEMQILAAVSLLGIGKNARRAITALQEAVEEGERNHKYRLPVMARIAISRIENGAEMK